MFQKDSRSTLGSVGTVTMLPISPALPSFLKVDLTFFCDYFATLHKAEAYGNGSPHPSCGHAARSPVLLKKIIIFQQNFASIVKLGVHAP